MIYIDMIDSDQSIQKRFGEIHLDFDRQNASESCPLNPDTQMPLIELRILPSYKLPDMKRSQSSAQEANSTGTRIFLHVSKGLNNRFKVSSGIVGA